MMEKKAAGTGDMNSAPGMSWAQTLAIAAAAGLSVANIYYAQPLLDLIADDLEIEPAVVGLIVTLTQVGYAIGLVFIVPIGDLIDRRKLIAAQGVMSAIVLVVVATAGGRSQLLIGMWATGLLAVLVQILVAYAAALSKQAQRGRVVGTVTSGVVAGILLARAVAGTLADMGGWRLVYLASALLTVVMVGILWLLLPRQSPERRSEGYTQALVSIPRTFLNDPILLFRGILALLIFASFSTFWTSLVLPLKAPPFSYSHTAIGLFGLVGLAGAMGATWAGRLADKGHSQRTTGMFLVLLLASWGPIAFLPSSIAILILGVLLLDLAIQAVHVISLSIVVARNPGKTSGLIAGYMVFYSIGSATGAITSTATYSHYGWAGVSVLGAVFSGCGVVLWIASMLCAKLRREPLEPQRA